jgi:DNA primase
VTGVSARPEPPTTASFARPERRGVSRRSVIEGAKARVETIALADLLCGPGQLRRVGKRWVARCPLPDHEDRSPSFTVYPETNSWFCFGTCLVGGDVVELARHAWGYEKGEVAMAAANLLHEFGHPIPERPASWYRKQERQKPVRDGVEAAKIRVARHHLYLRYFEPLVLATEDEDVRAHDAQLFWELTLPLAEHLVSTMMGVRR